MLRLLPLLLVLIVVDAGCRCFEKLDEPLFSQVKSPLPHTYLKAEDLPAKWDWRNVNGTNYCSKVLTQQNPQVCGSCWAEAATGALSDRYNIATNNKLRVQLGLQNLLNFKKNITGGACTGGNSLKAYRFIHKYGISDDTCAPFMGINWQHGFTVADMYDIEEVQNHMCFLCKWDGNCVFVPRKSYDLYGADEFGSISGVHEIKAEIFARGPVSCGLNSEPNEFNYYRGGIIRCENTNDPQCAIKDSDHVVVITGWGKDDQTGEEYWIGRNSYGSQWGEGAGGGWFRLKLGSDVLGLESNGCTWATPALKDVQRALQQFQDSL